AALERAMAELRKRHATLRTNFVLLDNEPAQVVKAAARKRLAMVELNGLSESQKEAGWQALLAQISNLPFDLAHDDLIRLLPVRLEPSSHLLVFVLHQLVADHWSLEVIAREFY